MHLDGCLCLRRQLALHKVLSLLHQKAIKFLQQTALRARDMFPS